MTHAHVTQVMPPNPAGAGNGGIASPLHSWLGMAAVPDQHRSAYYTYE
jgi:hypothetical protein